MDERDRLSGKLRPPKPPPAQRARALAKDIAIRLGLRSYRNLDWSLARWDRAYREGHTDAYGDLDELARYSLLVGYLRYIGGAPTVLDIGCGTGLLRKRIGAEDFSEYLGVDHTEAAIEVARESGYDRSRFLVGDPQILELEKHDVVICNEMLYFVPQHELLLDRIGELLVPRGHLLVSIFRHPGDSELWRNLLDRFDFVDRVWARNEHNRIGWRGWTVGWLRKR
jgi:2-polyprenyl-6-hydroxyphenyl methylase/3-demethylubiquinone-9 3-methyltransferase